MENQLPFELVDGQVILHDEFHKVDKVILNYEEVTAVKLLIQKYIDKAHGQN